VQASLVKLYRSWPRLDTNADPDAYLQRIMVNTHRSWWRARWRRETPTAVQAPSALAQVTKAAEATARQSYHVRSVTGVKGIGPVALNGEFDPTREVGEETSSTGARVRFAGGYRFLPLSDAFRAAYERTRGILDPAAKSWVRFTAPLRPGGAATLVNLTHVGIGPPDLEGVSPQDLLGLLQSVSRVTRDFGAPVSVSAPPASEVYIPPPAG
jgi:hypothetical protein